MGLKFFVVIFCFVFLAQAQVRTDQPWSDDRHLSSGARFRNLNVETNLVPDSLRKIGAHSAIKLHFLRAIKKNWTPLIALPLAGSTSAVKRPRYQDPRVPVMTDANGILEIAQCTPGQEVKIQLVLSNNYFKVVSQKKIYSVNVQIPCGTEAAIQFNEDSLAGQALGIWQVAQLGGTQLSTISDLRFWKKQITFFFPESADYYVSNTVHITLGHQWDVVGHEMGHAIYDQANVGAFGGGEHKIDQCYSSALAFSEGWASFFSAWVQIPINDPDAKFEYMVPRRAPIRIENVPPDVCGRSQSEWRVMSFLWDLVDVNNDGEVSAVAMNRLWNDLLNANARSVEEAVQTLVKKGWDPAVLKIAWNLNFPGTPPLSRP